VSAPARWLLHWGGSHRAVALVAVLLFAACLAADARTTSALPLLVASYVVTGAVLVAAHLDSKLWAAGAASASLAWSLVLHFLSDVPAWLSFSETAAMLLLLVSVWRAARSAVDVALVALLVAALSALPLRIAYGETALTVAVLAVAVASAAAAAVLGYRNDRADIVRQARMDERESISRELHDMVAHHISGVVVAAQAARLENPPAALAAMLAEIEKSGGDALEAMRRLVVTLRENSEAGAVPSATLGDVATLIEQFEASGVVGEVYWTLPERLTDPTLETTVHRIVRESLTNVAKYAEGAALVEVVVSDTDAGTAVTVIDSGGAAAEAPAAFTSSHVGILGMRERVEARGGALSSDRVGTGWRVTAFLPR
jgi:signal transduction histidine kinase